MLKAIKELFKDKAQLEREMWELRLEKQQLEFKTQLLKYQPKLQAQMKAIAEQVVNQRQPMLDEGWFAMLDMAELFAEPGKEEEFIHRHFPVNAQVLLNIRKYTKELEEGKVI